MSHKRETPRKAVLVRFEPETLKLIDRLRGEESRNAWIVRVVEFVAREEEKLK